MPSFVWPPSFSSSESSKPRVAKAQMGDGYQQRIRMGLNTDPKVWQLDFSNRSNLEREEIRAFLEARGGAEAFSWTTPWGQTDRKWVCEEWSIDPLNCGNNQIRATFRQVYDWSLITEVSFSRPAWDSSYSLFSRGSFIASTPAVAAKAWVTSSTAFAPGAITVAGADPYFSNVSLLLHMDGSNGGTTFVDSSSNGFTMAQYNSASTSTAQVKYGTASMRCGTPNNSYLETPANPAAFSFDGDFTIEMWVWLDSTQAAAYNRFFEISTYNYGILLGLDSIYVKGNQVFGAPPFTVGGWSHYALTRSGSTVRSFVNGTMHGSPATVSGLVVPYSSDAVVRIGAARHTGGQYIDGYIDELRITKGVARYTANFTPPSAAFLNS